LTAPSRRNGGAVMSDKSKILVVAPIKLCNTHKD